MSGGIAYVWDPKGLFTINCNHATVALEALEDTLDVEEVKNLIDQHFKLTGSTIAQNILEHWEQSIKAFVKVMPLDYKRVLAERMDHSEEEDTPIHDGEEAKHG
jgi:glutamate synthase (NADPH/NADH) large chain